LQTTYSAVIPGAEKLQELIVKYTEVV